MKILTINETIFRLPDSFDGTVVDALRLLADFIEDDTIPGLAGKAKTTRTPAPMTKEVWDDFVDTMDRGGNLLGNLSIQRFDPKKKIWDMLDNPKEKI